MNNWNQLADEDTLQKTINSLNQNQIKTQIVDTAEQAKELALSLIPLQTEIITMTSVTLETIGLLQILNESGNYNSVKTQLSKMDRQTQGLEMQKLGAAPDYSIGSVHAITMNGEVLIASNTGSQLPAYTYGASHVIWIASTKKIVKDIDQGYQRIYEHCLPLESERARMAYGVEGSAVNKILRINNEVKPDRINLILVKQDLGY